MKILQNFSIFNGELPGEDQNLLDLLLNQLLHCIRRSEPRRRQPARSSYPKTTENTFSKKCENLRRKESEDSKDSDKSGQFGTEVVGAAAALLLKLN